MLTIILLIILAAVLLVIYANMNKGMMYGNGNGNTVEAFWYYPNSTVGPGNVVRSAPFYYYPYRQYYQNLFPYVYYW